MNYTEMLFNRDERLVNLLNQADSKNLELIEEINKKENEIERLKKEIIGLNNCIIEFHSEFCNKQAEINRLNNIINELEKELKEDYDWICNSRSNGKSVQFGIDVCKRHFYDVLQVLKGSSNNE